MSKVEFGFVFLFSFVVGMILTLGIAVVLLWPGESYEDVKRRLTGRR